MFTYCQKLGDSTKTLRDPIGENIFLNIGLAKKFVRVKNPNELFGQPSNFF